jgi:hypothetical protein
MICATSDLPAQAGKVVPTKEFSGSVDDENLAQKAPAFIADAKALESLWKEWKISDKMPSVDFAKELVVITTSRGSKLKMFMTIEKGDLKVGGFGTRDLRPGFRYVLATVVREGIMSVNGKVVSKE